MIDLSELAHEHESSLRREADVSRVAALAARRHQTVWHSLTSARRATGSWMQRGQLGAGYRRPGAPGDDQWTRGGWWIDRSRCC